MSALLREGAAMGSNKNQVRQRQKEAFEKQIAARRAELAKRGIEGQAQAKDKVLLHLLAEFKRSRKAVESIAARVKIIEGARTQKEARAAQAAAEGPKQKKKKVEAAPAKEKKEKKAKKAEKAEKAPAAQA
jgi:hypothetical protein